MRSSIPLLVLVVVFALAAAVPARAAVPEPEASPATFQSLQGVAAEPLGAAEMDAIHGALTGQDLFDKLLADAQLINNPTLRDRVVSYLLGNEAKLVAYFNLLLSFHR